MIQNPSTELVASGDAAQPTAKKAKRIAQMAGAAALSFGLVGTFSLPAYATAPEPEGLPDGFVAAQSLETPLVEETIVPIAAPEGAISAEAIEQERQQKEAEEAAKRAEELKTQTSSSFSGKDIPAGVGAQGIVAAALAQLGVNQDCTALVEKSLRAVGIPAGDLGTQVYEYTALGGVVVTGGDYAPGDILVFPGQHVAVYVGNGQAVHGGWGGTTRLGGLAPGGETGLTVVRFG